jgi:bifunctional DNA-binding transcriptional regulator/antitoxin component of YhaV-PrlF toxin-antitoxin module
MPRVRVSRGGKISFPQEAMERLGIKTGDLLDFEIQESVKKITQLNFRKAAR